MQRLLLAVVTLLMTASMSAAQTSDSGIPSGLSPSMATSLNNMHMAIRRNLIESAEAMPAGDYSFKPTPQIRSCAELLAHVAMANYYMCSMARSEAMPVMENYERTITDKAAMVKALGAALAYCDGVFKETTDANVNQAVKVAGPGGGAQTTRGQVLMFSTTHNNEHYGNVILYLRLKGIVPPSTARVQPQK